MRREELRNQLSTMADDIQIGGDCNFRAMAVAFDRASANGTLTQRHTAHMTRLVGRANKLLFMLNQFWRDHPELDAIVDVGQVAASELGKNQ